MNRAQRAIQALKQHPEGLLACELTKILKVDFSGRPINEGITKEGALIHSIWEVHVAPYGTHKEKRYFIGSPIKNNALSQDVSVKEYVFIGSEMVPKVKPQQEAFL